MFWILAIIMFFIFLQCASNQAEAENRVTKEKLEALEDAADHHALMHEPWSDDHCSCGGGMQCWYCDEYYAHKRN